MNFTRGILSGQNTFSYGLCLFVMLKATDSVVAKCISGYSGLVRLMIYHPFEINSKVSAFSIVQLE